MKKIVRFLPLIGTSLMLVGCEPSGSFPSLATVPARVEPLLSDEEVKELKDSLEQEQRLTLREAHSLSS